MSDTDINKIEKAIQKLEITIEGRLTAVEKDVEYLRDELKEMKDSMRDHHVRREEFEPIKKIVYGLVSVLLMGVVGALLALVIA